MRHQSRSLGSAPALIAADLASDPANNSANFARKTPSDDNRGTHGDVALADLLRATADPTEAARCDLVVESIVESATAKQQLYARLQGHFGLRTILASNTSSIPIQRLAEGVFDPSRFCGMHFCHPVHERPLVEIVRGSRSSEQTIATAVAHVRRLDRLPIVVEDGPGFVVNRLLFPYLGEALKMLREGVPAEAIDRAATEFGMALGPLRLMDEIGLDTTFHAGWVLATAFPERISPSPLLVSMIKAGRLGCKTGEGFFTYPLKPAATDHEKPAAGGDALAFRLVAPMLFEAARILEEGKVRDHRAIDLAVLFGLGFPVEKGGLLWWADAMGLDCFLARLRSDPKMAARHPPTPWFERLADSGGFYALHG